MGTEEQAVAERSNECEETRDFPFIAAKAVFSALLLGVALVSLIRAHGTSFFPSSGAATDIQRRVVEWKAAVRSGDEAKALLLASSIATDDAPEAPRADYVRLALLNGLGTGIFSAPFNHFDYLRWRNAAFAADLARNQRGGWLPQAEIFKKVRDGLKIAAKTADSAKTQRSFEELWRSGSAPAAEWFRLYAEAVFQSGAQIMIVSLCDPDAGVVHAVCEIRGADGGRFVADPLKGRFWSDASVADLAADPSGLTGIWAPLEIDALKRPLHRLPADPMDYRACERRLADAVSRFGESTEFRFGVDPEKRMERWIADFADKNDGGRFSYWHFPFSSLKSSKAFPADWLAPELTLKEFWLNKRKTREDGNGR